MYSNIPDAYDVVCRDSMLPQLIEMQLQLRLPEKLQLGSLSERKLLLKLQQTQRSFDRSSLPTIGAEETSLEIGRAHV